MKTARIDRLIFFFFFCDRCRCYGGFLSAGYNDINQYSYCSGNSWFFPIWVWYFKENISVKGMPIIIYIIIFLSVVYFTLHKFYSKSKFGKIYTLYFPILNYPIIHGNILYSIFLVPVTLTSRVPLHSTTTSFRLLILMCVSPRGYARAGLPGSRCDADVGLCGDYATRLWKVTASM